VCGLWVYESEGWRGEVEAGGWRAVSPYVADDGSGA
jgi:hypothetical protein